MKRIPIKGVLVGGFLPRPTHDKFSLLSVWSDTSKAKYIQDYVMNLVKKSPSEEDMLHDIATKLVKKWDESKRPWGAYMEDVHRSLSKKLFHTHVERILQEMKEQKEAVSGGKKGKKVE